MKQKGFSSKSDAIRRVARDPGARSGPAAKSDYRSWLGLGLKTPLNPKPRFQNEDDLWRVRQDAPSS